MREVLKSETFGRIVLVGASVLFALFVCEVVIRVLGYPRKEVKVNLQEFKTERFANCYSSQTSNPLPLDLRESHQAERFFKHFKMELEQAQFVIAQTPFCIEYDLLGRKRGFSPKRDKIIVTVGDSFTFGEGIRKENTLAGLLEKSLPLYNVRNYGASNTNLLDIEGVLRGCFYTNWISKVKHVLYFYNLNDIPITKALKKKQKKLVLDFQNIRFDGPFAPKKKRYKGFWSFSKLFLWVQRRLLVRREATSSVKLYRDMYFSKENQKNLQKAYDSLTRMHKAVTKAGKTFTILLYPLLYKSKGIYPFAKIHQKMLFFCKKKGFRCIDLMPAFKEHPSLRKFVVHSIDFHPNGDANRLVIDYLKKNKLLSFIK